MKKEELPFVAFGNNELAEKPPVGKTVQCKNCGKRHKVKYGTDTKTGKVSDLLGFVSCGDKDFLVAVAGKEV